MPASSFLQNCQDRAGLARRMPRKRAGAECPTHACVATNATQSGTPAQQWRTPATLFGLRSNAIVDEQLLKIGCWGLRSSRDPA